MLYKYRIKNKKDFYECNIEKIITAFEKCDESIKCMDLTGGTANFIKLEIQNLKKKNDLFN